MMVNIAIFTALRRLELNELPGFYWQLCDNDPRGF